ncbi:MAG: DNA repair protein RecN [Xanthomonadaceae bacterium]|nr:DNA repair protein RecN [Xanthomonadaceae bacterium]
MLSRLYIRDFAVVREAEVGFEAGMTVVSGETGAGKSLLVDALTLLTGSRADSTMVRHGAERAELSAEFDLCDADEALDWLREQELDDGQLCHVRRVLRADGGSRAWINARPASASQLAELGQRLLEIHGQHEHQALLQRDHQLTLLDAFGDHAPLCREVRDLAAQWLKTRRELAALDDGGDPTERLDYLRHQLAELEAEALDDDALEQLQVSHRRQSNAAELIQGCQSALARLNAEDGFGLARGLGELHSHLGRLLEHEPRLAEVRALLESASIQIDEASAGLERIFDDLDLDPDRLQEIESRLARLHDLARKHRVALSGLAERRDQLSAEVDALRDAGSRAQSLAERAAAQERSWRACAERLSQARQAAAARLSDSVSEVLVELGMAASVFAVDLPPADTGEPGSQGLERVDFLIAANPGLPPRPLRKVASGGELSRISLAIEVAALGLDSVPTMIFDEVDSGIGGAVAEVVGQKLRSLGASRQVLCVTHLPQVAAQGHAHLMVSKAISGADSRSAVTRLDAEQRVAEIARMLGGIEIGPQTIALAREMLGPNGDSVAN